MEDFVTDKYARLQQYASFVRLYCSVIVLPEIKAFSLYYKLIRNIYISIFLRLIVCLIRKETQEFKMASEVSASTAPISSPHLQSVQKAMAIPTVEAAVGQVGALYSRVKDAHSLIEWALSTAEAGVTLAAHTAAPYVATPLAVGDAKVASYIDALEHRVPLVNEQPGVIVETTKQAVISRISPHVDKVKGARAAAGKQVQSLKEMSWSAANSLLSTPCGQKAVGGVDSGAAYGMQLLDRFLPPLAHDEATKEIVPASSDPALHTAQTVGQLSAVAVRRVWEILAFKINELRQSGVEFDVNRYLKALLAALHLATLTRASTPVEQSDKKSD